MRAVGRSVGGGGGEAMTTSPARSDRLGPADRAGEERGGRKTALIERRLGVISCAGWGSSG